MADVMASRDGAWAIRRVWAAESAESGGGGREYDVGRVVGHAEGLGQRAGGRRMVGARSNDASAVERRPRATCGVVELKMGAPE